jgi:large subunit ribosomal protein L30
MADKKLKITQLKSAIGYRKRTKATIEALGLRKINHSVEHNDSPAIRGMINAVSFLVKVEEF